MEIKAILQKPYTESQRMSFVVAYNHQLGYTINETEDELQALGYTQEELDLQEKERISKLTCTKRVFALMLQELGITYTMLKQLIATNEQAQLEWDLCVELERQNPLLDVMALQLGITSEQLDGLFMYANGEITIEQFREMYIIPEPDVDNPEEVGEENPVNTEVESDEV
jgi:hypothetical protein